MSKVTKRKHVMNEAVWDDYELPQKNQSIVKVLRTKGNNLHEITTPTNEEYLVSMPTKFRKNIWVKRGDYVVVEPIAEGHKVRGEIVKIMNKESIKYYKENNVWPKEFEDKNETKTDSDDDLFVNTNRNPMMTYSDSNSDDSDTDESDEGSHTDESDEYSDTDDSDEDSDTDDSDEDSDTEESDEYSNTDENDEDSDRK